MRWILLLVLSLAACHSKMDIAVKKGSPAAATNGATTMLITSRRPVVVHPGDQVELTGVGFRPTMTIALAGHSTLGLAGDGTIDVQVENDKHAVLAAPRDGLVTGPLNLTVTQEGTVQTISLLFDADTGNIPIFTGDSADICSNHPFFDADGVLRTGTKLCNDEATTTTCTQDGETDCIATSAFPAAQSDGLAAKVLSGQLVAGIIGSAAAASNLADCAPGGTDCIARSPLVGMNPASVSAGDIRAGVSIAGITGSLLPRPGDCSSDGETGCVAVSAFKAANMASVLAGNIKSGVTIAGVGGNVTPSPAACAADGAGSCVVDGTTYKAAKLANFAASDVKSGTQIAGVTGSLADCAADGATGCVAVSAFKAADMANVLASNIKSGVTIAGISGNVTPSPGECAADGAGSCVVDGTSFVAADKSQALATNVKSGVALAGVTGTYGPACASDGEGACLVDGSSYKAAKLANFAAGDVKSGIQIAGVTGSLADCAADGATGCVAVSGFKAADMTHAVAGNIKSGETIAGISGSVTPSPATCAADGAASCVVDGTSYVAANKSLALAGNVKSGIALAGVTGTYGPACVSDGSGACMVDGTTYKAAKLTNFDATKILSGTTIAGVSGTLGDCASNGAQGCYATGSYKAATTCLEDGSDCYLPAYATFTQPLKAINFDGIDAAKMLTTQTISGKTGTVDLTNLSAGNVKDQVVIGGVTGTYGATCTADGQQSCLVSGSFKALNPSSVDGSKMLTTETLLGVTGTISACGSDGASACYVPTYAATTQPYKAIDYDHINTNKAKVRTSLTIAGLAGTLADCSSNGATDCVTTTSYKSADLTNLSAGNIKSGVTVAGQLGDYPSSTHPLTGADSTADLDLATFDAKIKSSASFEWFDSSGSRYTNSGDTDIAVGNIANGVTIFGTTGSLVIPSPCTGDGQSDCFVPPYDGSTNVFKSADTSAFSTWDIRSGKTVGGVSGSITFYKNMADTASFNRTTGAGALAGVDIYDTIDDYNNGTFPTQNPGGWDQATGVNWLRDSQSDTDSDGTCDGIENCVYKDQNSGLLWSRSDLTTKTWENAITYCDGLNGSNYGGYSGGWRLPTEKELLQAYVDGIWSQKGRLNFTPGHFWSSSSSSSFPTTDAMQVGLSDGYVTNFGKTSLYYVMCVR